MAVGLSEEGRKYSEEVIPTQLGASCHDAARLTGERGRMCTAHVALHALCFSRARRLTQRAKRRGDAEG